MRKLTLTKLIVLCVLITISAGFGVSAQQDQPQIWIHSVEYNPAGTLFAVSGGIFNAGSYEPYLEIFDNNDVSVISLTPDPNLLNSALAGISWSSDGTRLISHVGDGQNNTIYVWNMNINDPNYQFGDLITSTPNDNTLSTIVDLVWSPDGNFIASKELFSLRIWDARNDVYVVTDSLNIDGGSISWHPNSNEIALGNSGAVHLIPISSVGEIVYTPATINMVGANLDDIFPAVSVAWNHDGSRLAISTGYPDRLSENIQDILIFDTSTDPEMEVARISNLEIIYSLQWSNNKQWIAGLSSSGNIVIVDAIAGIVDSVQPIDYNPGLFTIDWNDTTGEIVFGQSDGTIGTISPIE